MMLEFVNTSLKEPAYVTDGYRYLEKFSDVACTLMARDWKGAGNQRYNAIIEITK